MSLHNHIHKYFKGIKDLSEIIDKKKRYKYIGQSLRMTIHD